MPGYGAVTGLIFRMAEAFLIGWAPLAIRFAAGARSSLALRFLLAAAADLRVAACFLLMPDTDELGCWVAGTGGCGGLIFSFGAAVLATLGAGDAAVWGAVVAFCCDCGCAVPLSLMEGMSHPCSGGHGMMCGSRVMLLLTTCRACRVHVRKVWRSEYGSESVHVQ